MLVVTKNSCWKFGYSSSFSFSMPKLINGSGGAIITNNKKLATKLRYYKNFGEKILEKML